jgi:ATP-dependent DNA helicase RecG
MRDGGTASRDVLSRPVLQVRGVGPVMARQLAKKGISTVEDLLYFIPRGYEDRRTVTPVAETRPGMKATIRASVIRSTLKRFRRRTVLDVVFRDESGVITATWFNGNPSRLRQTFAPSDVFFLSGAVSLRGDATVMIHPDVELVREEDVDPVHAGKIVPLYSETDGLSGKRLRRIMAGLLGEHSEELYTPLPADLCRRRNLVGLDEALRNIHFPPGDADFDEYNDRRSKAHRRLIFDEFFFFQLRIALKRADFLSEAGVAFRIDEDILETFSAILPFDLTGAQKRAVKEILADMARPRPMHRLLQGDVGSGKTVVSMMPLIVACRNGFQSAVMAPTEILAMQHYGTVGEWAKRMDLKAVLLTGSMKGDEHRRVLEEIREGRADIIVGTHALIQEKVRFRRLGAVVIDEQHRFGVLQRARLRDKRVCPDVLVMTATPIPRTLAMTVYGDLDLTVIDEMPPSRQGVETMVLLEGERTLLYDTVRREASAGNRVFIVYPLVEESKTSGLKDATGMAAYLRDHVFSDFAVGLVHGRMNGLQRREIMEDFRNGNIQILVATTVVEVGVDIPSASLMVVEQAERFGLSQLHQLRGRVGRGDLPSRCILAAGRGVSGDAARRLRIMERTNNGFEIAEEDLKIRGPGEFLGIRQWGFPDFRIGDVLRDGELLESAREEAFNAVGDARKGCEPLIGERFLNSWRERLGGACRA